MNLKPVEYLTRCRIKYLWILGFYRQTGSCVLKMNETMMTKTFKTRIKAATIMVNTRKSRGDFIFMYFI